MIGSDECVHLTSPSSSSTEVFVGQYLHRRDDLTPLTDPTWIATTLTKLPAEATQSVGAGTKWKGLGTRVEVIELRSQASASSQMAV